MQALKGSTRITFGWTYVVAWLGIGFLAVTIIFLWASHKAIRDEENGLYEQKHAQYFQHIYGAQAISNQFLPKCM